MTQKIIDVSEIEKMPRYEQDKFMVRVDDLRALLDKAPSASGEAVGYVYGDDGTGGMNIDWYKKIELGTTLYATQQPDRVAELEAELEKERMRLAACGVVALANTASSAMQARAMHEDYKSASLNDVIHIVDSEMALRDKVAKLEATNKKLLDELAEKQKFIDKAFQFHPNLDLDVQAIAEAEGK